jgi:hypothetical protein
MTSSSDHFAEQAFRHGLDPKSLQLQDKNHCAMIWHYATLFAANGLISQREAQDCQRYVAQHVLRHFYLEDPEEYRRTRDNGELDHMMELAASHPNESEGASDARREAAFNRVVAGAVDYEIAQHAQAGFPNDDAVRKAASIYAQTDPKHFADIRQRHGLDQSIDLDQTPRPLTDGEQGYVVGHMLAERRGAQPTAVKHEEPDPIADSEAFMEQYVARRNAEEASRRHPLLNNPVAKSLDSVATEEQPRSADGRFASEEKPREI